MLRLLALTVLLAACDDGGEMGGSEAPDVPPAGPAGEGEGEGEGEASGGDGSPPGAPGEGEGEGVGDPCAIGPDGVGDGPSPRSGARMLFDPPRDRLWMFGGDLQRSKPEGEDPQFTDEVWEFTLCPPRWRKVESAVLNKPNKRGGHGLAHDEQGERAFVVFGRDRPNGEGTAPVPDRFYEVQSDLWQYDLAGETWSKIRFAGDAVAPTPRHGHSLIYDLAQDRLVMFGGVVTGVHVGGCTDLPCDALRADTWFLELGGARPTWTPLQAETTPPRRQDHAAVLDGATGRMVVTGGSFGKERYHDDVWVLDLQSGVWTEAAPQGQILTPRRALGAFAYHPGQRAMLLFGGLGADGFHNDSYLIDLAQLVWARLSDDDPREGSGRPAPRAEAAIVHIASGKFAVFGGESQTNVLGDLWQFDAETKLWTNLSP